jgi:hypothetical protein
MGIGLWGSSPLCEIGISRRSVYQMTTSREQARGEGNCGRVTDRGKEACECMGKRRVCRQPSVRHSLLECILTKSARLRTETPYKAGLVRRVSQTSRSRTLSIDQVKGELVQRKPMLLSWEICAAPGSKSSRRLKARNRPAQAGLGNAEVSRGRSTELPIPTGIQDGLNHEEQGGTIKRFDAREPPHARRAEFTGLRKHKDYRFNSPTG